MGSIYKRGTVFWVKYYRNGKPYRESSMSDKETDAKRLLKKREGEISGGKIPGVYFEKVKFDDLADNFISDYRINNKKTLNRAERSVKQFKEFFGGSRVTDITTPRIQSFIEQRLTQGKNGKSNATVNRELAALKRILNLGLQQTPPLVDRVPHIPMLKENNVRKGFFEHSDFFALRKALPNHLQGLVTFAYKTGWRISEIEDLTWAQVDLDNSIVRLESGTTKNDDARTVYLDDELKAVFKKQKEQQKALLLNKASKDEIVKISPYVFTNASGTDKIKDFRGTWAKACKDAKIGKKLFHDFRRTAVRNMVRAGIPERVAMMISGHKTRSVFDRYNVVSETDLKVAAQMKGAT